MKRVLLTVALCVAASASFAQKKAVSEAESIAKGQNADFAEARNLIKGALENPETKNDAKTWFVAGFIENQQFDAENTKQMLGQPYNEPVMHDALYNILPYFLKSYELDQLPNAKGKVKPKFSKKIKDILGTNYRSLYNGGVYYFNQGDYKKAYDFFNQYIDIANLPMFEGTPTATKDTAFMQTQFYAAVAALRMEDSKSAIAALKRAKDYDYERYSVYTSLSEELINAKDSVNFEKTLIEGYELFPDSIYFVESLCNFYIITEKNEEALKYLNLAASKQTDSKRLASIYNLLGNAYYDGMKDTVNAEKYYKLALEKNSSDIYSNLNLGRLYFDKANVIRNEAEKISPNDSKLYFEEINKVKELLKKAIPYLEKAHKEQPDNRNCMIVLRSIYYTLDMGAELKAIEDEMNK